MLNRISPAEGRTSGGNLRYLEELRELARRNRKLATETEKIMWNLLRRKGLGFKFTRQKPIDRFVVDFYCSELLLAVEIDGGYHINKKGYDVERDKRLGWRGIEVIRYGDKEMLKNSEGVKRDLIKKIEERINFLSPLPCQGKGKG